MQTEYLAPVTDPDAMMCHVVRLQDEGRSVAQIEAWFAQYGLTLDVRALLAKAESLPEAERERLVRQSRQVTRQVTPMIVFGSVTGTFVVAWVFVAVVALIPFADLFLGGAIGAGIKIGSGVKSMLSDRKPLAVFIGGVMGWVLFVVSYLIFVGGVTVKDVICALILMLLSTWYLWRVRANVGVEGGLIAFGMLTVVYLTLVILVHMW